MRNSILQSDDLSPYEDTRTRILIAAAQVIAREGLAAATTRAVARAAGVQAPTIYRLFGDKRGMLDAVAAHTLNTYVANKSSKPAHADPVQALRDGWDMHIAFCLANPALFPILSNDPVPGPTSQAVDAGLDILRQRVRSIALAGRLITSETRAVNLLRSALTGTVITLLNQPVELRDDGLTVAAREAVMVAITRTDSQPGNSGLAAPAAMLRSHLDRTDILSKGERQLLIELLDRIANQT